MRAALSAAPLCTLLVALAAGAFQVGGQDGSQRLADGVPHEGRIELADQASLCFELELPADVAALELLLEAPLADLDLFAHPGEHPDGLDEAIWSSIGDEGPERILVQNLADDRLVGGRLYVCVSYSYVDPPLVDGKLLESAPFRLVARSVRSAVDAQLVPGTPLRGWVGPESGGLRTYRVDVPEGAGALRLDLFDTDGDLDLFARHRVSVARSGPRLALAQNQWGDEHLVLDAGSRPTLDEGRWFVHVAGLVDASERSSFGLLASFDPAPPRGLLGLPELAPRPEADGFERALPGVFELFCGPFNGSGTCVGAGGWVLTNAHVVDTGRDESVVLCATTERGRPARESFRGRVVEIDRALDLALVQVTSGFRGEALPEDYRFPVVPRGDPGSLSAGDPLYLAGYPTTGGRRSRVTRSLSSGIVAGFERKDGVLVIKTDAEIESGSSGGAALDREGRLVGVPSAKVELGSGHFGFVQPIDALAPAWLERIDGDAQR